jgi:hypothetical protein
LSCPAASGLRDGVDELVLRHFASFLDADAGRKLDQLRLLVGVETIWLLLIELVRRLLRGRRCPFSQFLGRCDTRLGVNRSLLRFVLELLRLAVGFLGGRPRRFRGLVG